MKIGKAHPKEQACQESREAVPQATPQGHAARGALEFQGLIRSSWLLVSDNR